ncbi:MAG: hypothetical protein QM722_05135 [Piscinibacter sp.]
MSASTRPPRVHIRRALLLTLVVLAAGCSTRPDAHHDRDPAADAAPGDCAALQADVRNAEQAVAEAQEQKQNAWKAVVPFAVVARQAQARSTGAQAERQLERLRGAQRRQGCAVE